MKAIVQRNIELTLDLFKVASDFGYNLEVDAYDDVYHNGYSSESIRKDDLSLPKEYTDLNKYFPQAVSIALEDAERSAYASAIYEERLDALKECLLKIDLLTCGCEYQEMEGSMVRTKAGITKVKIDKDNGKIIVSICNPEHLINAMVAGVGRYSPELSAFEAESADEIASRFHHLSEYFSVYGVSKPSGDLSSQYTPSIDDEFFKEEIKNRLVEINLEEAAQAVLDYVEETGEEADCSVFAKFVNFSSEDIKKVAKELNKQKSSNTELKIK